MAQFVFANLFLWRWVQKITKEHAKNSCCNRLSWHYLDFNSTVNEWTCGRTNTIVYEQNEIWTTSKFWIFRISDPQFFDNDPKFFDNDPKFLGQISCPPVPVSVVQPACLIPKVIEKKNEMQWLYICIAFIGGIVVIVGASKLYWYCAMNKKWMALEVKFQLQRYSITKLYW